MHKTVFTWFGNLPTSTKLQGFHYHQEKIQSAATMFFSLSKTQQQWQTLITKNGCYILRTGLQWPTKRAKPPLHGLSLRKSLIKNHATLFKLGRVINRIKHKLGSTKPNIKHLVSFVCLNIFLHQILFGWILGILLKYVLQTQYTSYRFNYSTVVNFLVYLDSFLFAFALLFSTAFSQKVWPSWVILH